MGGAITSGHVANRPLGEAESISAPGIVEADGDVMGVDGLLFKMMTLAWVLLQSWRRKIVLTK